MAGADDDAIVGFFQSLDHAVLPPMFCDAENSKFPGLRTQIFAWPYCATPVFVIASESEAIQVSQRSVDCFVAFAPRSDADMLPRHGEGAHDVSQPKILFIGPGAIGASLAAWVAETYSALFVMGHGASQAALRVRTASPPTPSTSRRKRGAPFASP